MFEYSSVELIIVKGIAVRKWGNKFQCPSCRRWVNSLWEAHDDSDKVHLICETCPEEILKKLH